VTAIFFEFEQFLFDFCGDRRRGADDHLSDRDPDRGDGEHDLRLPHHGSTHGRQVGRRLLQ
jgi:hypothetical protein